MKKIIGLLAMLIAFAASAQTVSIPYPCLKPFTHDSLFKGSGVIPVPVYTQKCDTAWWGRIKKKTCKPVFIGYKDSTIYFNYTDAVTHDSLQVCFKDSNVVADINYGAKLQGTVPEQIEAAKLLGVRHMRVNSIELSTFNGDVSGIKKWYDAGFKVIQTVTWEDANPASFAKGKNLEIFKSRLEQLIRAAGDMVSVYVIENEQTQEKSFYDYTTNTIFDYLAELQAGVDVCERYQKYVADGGLHIKIIEQISLGVLRKDNVIRQNECIKYYKTIRYSKFIINVHTEFANNYYVLDQVKKSCDYLRAQTGHNVMSNEYHTEFCSDEFVAITVNEWKKAKPLFLCIWGGNYLPGVVLAKGDSEADAINVGSRLAINGAAYKKAIE